MSQSKSYKHQKRGKDPFVKIDHWIYKTEAWKSLSPKARALYLEFKFRYNGSNNGSVFLSHRDAAKAINVSRPTVAAAFQELKVTGFIVETQGYCLGIVGRGKASHYALTEYPLNGKPPSKEFVRWRKAANQRTHD